ncbi:MAG: M23 family metallopeptidase [Deltaproteobacteria bacterium]|nr:M23 family metallopeptidase [Deltaproteobacteria bacterium]
MRVITLALVAAIALGCATSSGARPGSSGDATLKNVAAPAAAPAPSPTVKKAVPARLPVKKVGPARAAKGPPALPLATALKRFQAGRMHFPRRKLPEMSMESERHWYAMLDQVHDALADDAGDGRENEELSLLMRTRMTLETEFQMDQRRHRQVSPELTAQVKETLAEVDERVRELRSLSTGFAMEDTGPFEGTVTLRHPVQLVNITSYFGRRRDPIVRRQTRFHAGVDLAGWEGTLVMSAGPGVVAYSDWQGGGGNHVIVVHPNGYRTHYSHLSKILVEQGTPVDEGTPIGLMGQTGRSTGPHLHFSVSRHGGFVDPLEVLDVPLGRDGPAVPRS